LREKKNRWKEKGHKWQSDKTRRENKKRRENKNQ
jgi:hypothetical protein